MNEKRFDIKQNYIPRPIILPNQPTRFLGYKYRINQILNLCGGVEIRNKVNDLIKKGNAPNVTIMCTWEMTIMCLRMLFIIIIIMETGRLSAIFAAMYIYLKVATRYHDKYILNKDNECLRRIRSYGRT